MPDSDDELESSAVSSPVGMPEVVSIICTRPMVVGPLRDATRTSTLSVEVSAELEADELPELEDVPLQAASMPVMVADAASAIASRLVAERWVM